MGADPSSGGREEGGEPKRISGALGGEELPLSPARPPALGASGKCRAGTDTVRASGPGHDREPDRQTQPQRQPPPRARAGRGSDRGVPSPGRATRGGGKPVRGRPPPPAAGQPLCNPRRGSPRPRPRLRHLLLRLGSELRARGSNPAGSAPARLGAAGGGTLAASRRLAPYLRAVRPPRSCQSCGHEEGERPPSAPLGPARMP